MADSKTDSKTDSNYDNGLDVRRSTLGADYVDKAIASADGLNDEFQRWVTEYCWGAVWTREGLSRRDRGLINIAMLSALNRPDEFRLHLRGAVNNGCTLEEIKEVLLQVTMYCGFPAGVTAFKLAREVLTDMGVDIPAKG